MSNVALAFSRSQGVMSSPKYVARNRPQTSSRSSSGITGVLNLIGLAPVLKALLQIIAGCRHLRVDDHLPEYEQSPGYLLGRRAMLTLFEPHLP